MTGAATRPVFILGPERSGANLLAWSLGQHPALHTVHDSGWVGRFALDLMARHEDALTDGDRSGLGLRQVSRDAFVSEFRSSVVSMLGGGDPLTASRRAVHAAPEHAPYVGPLLRLFPLARFIHVVRDAESTVALLRDRSVSQLFHRSWSESAAWEHWLGTVRTCLEAEQAWGSDVVLRVRLASLLRTPPRVLEKCLRFIGEEWDDACLRPVRNVSAGVSASSQTQTADLPVRDEAIALSTSLTQGRARRHRRNEKEISRIEAALLRRVAVREPAGSSPLVRRVTALVDASVPYGGRMLVVSRGDDNLLELFGRDAGHFPQTPDGRYLGHHPADSAEAIERLATLLDAGAQYLVVPSTSFWWLEHYVGFREYLEQHGRVIAYHEDVGIIYAFGVTDPRQVSLLPQGTGNTTLDLFELRVAAAEDRIAALGRELERVAEVRDVRQTLTQIFPQGARVLIVSHGDDELLDVGGGIQAGHFPQSADGRYAGHHPSDSAHAIALLEQLRKGGAEYLVFPPSASWWLDYYEEFRSYLDRFVAQRTASECVIYRLAETAAKRMAR